MEISRHVQALPASGIRKMFDLADKYDNVVNLCIGEPDFATPQHIIDAGSYALNHGYTKYVANAGLPELREAVAEKMTKVNDIPCTAENVMITNGAGQSLMSVLQCLINPGDEVILPDPGFPNYLGYLMLAQAVTVPVPTKEENHFHIKAEDIQKAVTSKTKVIILNSPCNPTGAVMDRDELIAIGKLAKEKDIYIISDEPYESIIYDGKKLFSIGSVPEIADHVITVNSFSKTYAMTGWRVGYTVGPTELIKAMTLLQESLTSSVNAAAQYAAAVALRSEQTATEAMRKTYEERRNALVEGLNEIKGVSCIMPEGAFYAFVNIKGTGLTSQDLARKLIEECQVVTTPGDAFGAAGEGYLRISYASSRKVLEEAVERIAGVLGRK